MATNVRVDDDLYKALAEIREKTGVPVTEQVRRAIREYLKQNQSLWTSSRAKDFIVEEKHD